MDLRNAQALDAPRPAERCLSLDFSTIRFAGGEPTFAGASRNSEDAPIAAIQHRRVDATYYLT
jgi:hypothetical protein